MVLSIGKDLELEAIRKFTSQVADRVISSKDYQDALDDCKKMKEEINDAKFFVMKKNEALQNALYSLEKIKAESRSPKMIYDNLVSIAKHKYVEKLEADTSRLIIYVVELKSTDGSGNFINICRTRVLFDITNGSVNIYPQNKNEGRSAYWSEVDPHPHVDGDNGYCCLGSADSTILDMLSEREYYGAFLMILDFLQHFNPSDPAGSKYVCWDVYDEDGNLIQESRPYYNEDMYTCETCGCECECDEMYYCEDCEMYYCEEHAAHYTNIEGGRTLCNSCKENYIECSNCGNIEHNDNLYGIDGYGDVCERCIEEYFNTCDKCADTFHNDDLTYDEYANENYCYNCMAEIESEREEAKLNEVEA